MDTPDAPVPPSRRAVLAAGSVAALAALSAAGPAQAARRSKPHAFAVVRIVELDVDISGPFTWSVTLDGPYYPR